MRPSPSYLYKVARNLMLVSGDVGSHPSSAMAAIELFGSPTEEEYPYVVSKYDEEPSAFHYFLGLKNRVNEMTRLDSIDISGPNLLLLVKAYLSMGLPITFGFVVYDSSEQSSLDGKIPYPCEGDKICGGHAVLAINYNDSISIKNPNCEYMTYGAIRFQNSYETQWGDKGYGWLPYEYILNNLTDDWWTVDIYQI